ncbi:MAG: hypothetical protein IKH88_08290 [Prevotella sp.]|nr:hypothetical protein [Prevotella sp.]
MKITINENMRQSAGATGYITQLLSSFADKREALILVYLLANADNEGMVTSSTYAMAIELKTHRQSLSRIINHLAQTGWVSIEETAPCTPYRDGIIPVSPKECQPHLMTVEKQPTVTESVTSDVTSDVTNGVTYNVTNDVTFSDNRKEVTTHCASSGCKHSHLEDVTLFVTSDVTDDVTLDVTIKEEKKQKKEEFPPAPPKEEKKQKKEKNTHTTAHAHEKKPAEKLEERRRQFLATLTPYHERYGQEMVTQFGDYWTEPNRSITRMRFELQRTWNTPLRLATWARNDKIFTQNHYNHDKTSRPTAAEFIAHAQRTAIEETERFIREAEIRRGGIPPHLPI